jgi:glutamate-1-semialdehyde 2,1-aminomutase
MEESGLLFERAVKVMPGGVNSPVRAFKAVGGNPLFIEGADGSKIRDVDGNEYIDYVMSWGPMILGHNNTEIQKAVTDAVQNGLSFGAPSEVEVKLAEKIVAFTGTAARTADVTYDMVRMVNSGTEAVMSALRLARAYTGRDKIIKFEGCYHGHSDSMLVKAGSGALTFGEPDSPGVTSAIAADTLTAAYNDLASVEKLLANNETACIIVEPVAGNMGVVLPAKGFLEGLRQLCDAYGALLIFDEVITGFRLCKGGAQEYFGVRADLVTYGKIIGGGMPVGAYCGRKEIMELIAPCGLVYQAGTLSGNPIAMAAGLKQLELLESRPDVYAHINKMGDKLAGGFRDIIHRLGLKACVNHIGSLVCVFFGVETAGGYSSVKNSDKALYAEYFRKMLKAGVYLAPAQFEAMFVSFSHTEGDIDETLSKAEWVLKQI